LFNNKRKSIKMYENRATSSSIKVLLPYEGNNTGSGTGESRSARGLHPLPGQASVHRYPHADASPLAS